MQGSPGTKSAKTAACLDDFFSIEREDNPSTPASIDACTQPYYLASGLIFSMAPFISFSCFAENMITTVKEEQLLCRFFFLVGKAM